jgi:hypothetical protein
MSATRVDSRAAGPALVTLVLLVALIALAGCTAADGEAGAADAGAADAGVAAGAAGAKASDATGGPAAARAPGVPHLPAAGPARDRSPGEEPPTLAVVRSGIVEGRASPGGGPFEVAVREPERPGHDRVIGRRPFEISLRQRSSTSYPCASCHRPGRAVIQPERAEDAHRYVLPRHPNESGTRCTTCHAPDDVESLVLASGERIGLAHAYRLCAQCHYSQVDDWAAGAHGKRLDGWRGRRVVMGCADCHDPHEPAVAPRDPFPGPTLPRTGRAP